MDEQDIFGLREFVEVAAQPDSDRKKYLQTYFNLKWNPFPEIGVPESQVSSIADIRSEVINTISGWLTEALSNRKTKILVIKGPYGSGKSLLLRKIVADLNQTFSVTGESRPKVIYVYRPSFEAQALNRAILNTIGLDNVRKLIWNVIREELSNDLAASPKPAPFAALLDRLSTSAKPGKSSGPNLFSELEGIPSFFGGLFDASQIDDYRRFLQRYDSTFRRSRLELKDYFVGLLGRGLKSSSGDSTLPAFIDFLVAYEDSEAWQALLSLNPRRDRTDYVRKLLSNLVNLLRTDNYTYLLVAIDEFEQVTDKALLSSKERTEYAYTMMEIINQIDDGLGLIISISDEGFKQLSEVTPLKDRLGAPVELRPLQPNEIKELIEFYLNQARVAEDDEERTGTFPFGNGFIEAAASKLQVIGLGLTPRNVVQFFHFLINYCSVHKTESIDIFTVEPFFALYRQAKSQK